MSKEAVYGHIHTRSENDPNINSYDKKNLGGGQFNFAFKSFVMLLGCWKTSLLSIKIGGNWVVNVFSSFLQKKANFI